MGSYQMPQRSSQQQSIPNLVRRLLVEMTDLVQHYVELIRTEVSEESQKVSKAFIYGILSLIFFQVTLIFIGNLLMLFLILGNFTFFGATIITLAAFLILALVNGGLCIKQIRSAQSLIKQRS